MFFRCEKSGEKEKTTLWTNSNPSSNFSGQDVTLSSNIEDFSYIEIKFISYRNSSPEKKQTISQIYNSEELMLLDNKNTTETRDNKFFVGVVTRVTYHNTSGSNSTYTRTFYVISSKIIHFNGGIIWNSGTANDSICIPVEIVGIK